MRTNTARQQTVRHMTPAAKAAMLDADIEAGYQRQQAYLTEQRRRRECIQAMRENGEPEADIQFVINSWFPN